MTAVDDRPSWDALVQRTRDEWGDRLVPVRPEHVDPLVEPRTREFLTMVGLPDAGFRDITPIRDERLLEPFERDGRRYVVVAAQPFYCYAIDVRTGWVQWMHHEPDYSTPANSSIAAFVLAVGLLQHQLGELEVGTRESVAQAVDTVWDELDTWDPEGLADEESRWNVLLNEYAMEYD
ncbi:SUKH-4 family immunity protein [Dactylosporangium siamense]|uniref:SUKH-4 family immunity protein n=1 Tax=Dactylosporangium siamense TaxID=685454 RepID=UPI0031EDAFBB